MKPKYYFFLLSALLSFVIGCENKTSVKVDAKIDPSVNAVIPQKNDLAKKEILPAQNSSNEIIISASKTQETKEFKPFYVFSNKGAVDNHYVPSGFMPNGNCLTFEDSWQENCYQGKTCIKVNYDVKCSRADAKWAGIYWLNPANNWGRKKGGYNLTGASKLTFWAKGEVGGEQIMEFIVGGIEGGDYPDSDIAVLGPVILSAEWRQYEIDLNGKDLSYISGGFAWSSNEEVNGDACVFYLDEIKFE